jgi:hypothetical protein
MHQQKKNSFMGLYQVTLLKEEWTKYESKLKVNMWSELLFSFQTLQLAKLQNVSGLFSFKSWRMMFWVPLAWISGIIVTYIMFTGLVPLRRWLADRPANASLRGVIFVCPTFMSWLLFVFKGCKWVNKYVASFVYVQCIFVCSTFLKFFFRRHWVHLRQWGASFFYVQLTWAYVHLQVISVGSRSGWLKGKHG